MFTQSVVQNSFIPIEYLEAKINTKISSIEWLAGDGSNRSYFRINGLNKTYVLMKLSESDRQKFVNNTYEWILIQKLLNQYAIPVPEYYCTINDYLSLVIEDYGDVTLESYVSSAIKHNLIERIHNIYQECFNLIIKMFNIPYNSTEVWTTRIFDADKYLWELNFFVKHFLVPVLRYSFNKKEQQYFEVEAKNLSKYLEHFSKYFTHRDYHSRNIMIKDGQIALLDFQDARLGGAAYDLVSLVFDNYVTLDMDFRLALLEQGIRTIKKYNNQIAEEIEQNWTLFALQRQLKAIGSYGYLTIKQNRGNYLKYVPTAIKILNLSNIYNQTHWPFLSYEIINILNKTLNSEKLHEYYYQ